MSPLEATLQRLLTLHPKLIDLSLERMQRILAQLGHPEKMLPPVIHVTGTNGKGSTVAFMRGMLEAGGRTAHVYTSPHLVRFNERIRLAAPDGGRLVDDATLVDALAECERANRGETITFFEITTAAALLLFSRHPADVLLLEVGLGGRLDSTNVVDRPLASAITPISLDHADHLGQTIEKIAAEKAGIIKRGAPVVVSPQPEDAMRVIEQRADMLHAPLYACGQSWMVSEEHGRLVYQDDDGLLDLPAPRLPGRHQFVNAGTAIAALRVAGFRLPAAAFEAGLLKVEWPARMQRLTQGALIAFAPHGSEIWLDGGHNPDGGRAIAATLADLEERVPRPLVLIVGMLATKDFAGYLRNFSGLARQLYAVPIAKADKPLPPEVIAQTARDVGVKAETAPDVAAALQAIDRLSFDAPPRILICGSLYLAGEVLARNGTPPE
jgi:dihydrofolate synthase/folylpolyglutamate synthase